MSRPLGEEVPLGLHVPVVAVEEHWSGVSYDPGVKVGDRGIVVGIKPYPSDGDVEVAWGSEALMPCPRHKLRVDVGSIGGWGYVMRYLVQQGWFEENTSPLAAKLIDGQNRWWWGNTDDSDVKALDQAVREAKLIGGSLNQALSGLVAWVGKADPQWVLDQFLRQALGDRAYGEFRRRFENPGGTGVLSWPEGTPPTDIRPHTDTVGDDQ